MSPQDAQLEKPKGYTSDYILGALVWGLWFSIALCGPYHLALGVALMAFLFSFVLLSRFIQLILQYSKWRSSIRVIVYYIAIFFMLPLARSYGISGQMWLFNKRTDFVEAARMIEKSLPEEPAPLHEVQLPEKYSKLAGFAEAQKDENGIVTVLFITRGGFPTHLGYLYRSNGQIDGTVKGFCRRVNEHWFLYSEN